MAPRPEGFEWYALSEPIRIGLASWDLIGLLATRQGTAEERAAYTEKELLCEAAHGTHGVFVRPPILSRKRHDYQLAV